MITVKLDPDLVTLFNGGDPHQALLIQILRELTGKQQPAPVVNVTAETKAEPEA